MKKTILRKALSFVLAAAMVAPIFPTTALTTKADTAPELLAFYDFEDFAAGENDTLTDGSRVLTLETLGGTLPALTEDAGRGQVLKLHAAGYSNRAYAVLPENPFAGQNIEDGITLNFWTNSQGDVVRERCLIDFEVAPATTGRAGTFAVNQLSSYWNTTDQNGNYIDFRYDNTIGLNVLNEWKMITMVATTDGVTFYTNGAEATYTRYGSTNYTQLIKDLTGTGGLVSDPSETNVRLGASLATYWSCANALIDDIAFYGEALSVEEIQALYVVKDALRVAVNAEKAAALPEEEYTEDSWAAYADALTYAEEILNNDNALQSEVDAAAAALAAAKEDLTFANNIVSIEVTAPDKTQYFIGDELDLTGMAVTGIREDESTMDITSLCTVTGYDADKAGIQTITVTYKDLTAAFEVSVAYRILQKYEAENAALTSPAKRVSRSDASGGYKVGTIDNAEAAVKFTVSVPEDGTYRVDIAADGNVSTFPNPAHKYWINDDTENAQTISYTKSTTWDTWYTYPVDMELKAGENTITFTHAGITNSYSELDYIIVYLANPEYSITLGGEPMEGFDMETYLYEADVEDLANIPEAAVVFEEESDAFTAEVTQGTKERPETYIRVASVDGTYAAEYKINFFGPDTFTNPLLNFGADPFITYVDGYYYYVRGKSDKSLWVSKSDDLTRIGKVEPVKVYEPSGDEPAYQIWAPEIHYIDGYWYIYYAACETNDNIYHRMYVAKSKTSDAQGEYEFVGQLSPTTDNWAIDQTVLEYNGKLYAVWSGWHYTTNVDQRIYIAEMSDPTTIVGERVELSLPEYNWETQGGTPYINEGPQVAISPDGTVNIVYSASGSWSDYYCLGMLTLKDGGDPMNADDWIKSEDTVFEKNNSTTWSTGHACFVPSPDGTETYLIYHATKNSGDGWNGRGPRIQRVYWNEDGTPDIGTALEYNGKINMPSGTPDTEYVTIEAETATLYGAAAIAETYNSSSGKKVTGLSSTADYAEFKFNVETAGTYTLYIGAATSNADAALTVKVNDGEAVTEAVQAFNVSSTSKVCGDNWFGYEVEVEFVEGENTVIVGGSDSAAADIDYIEYAVAEKTALPYVDVAETDWFYDVVYYNYVAGTMTGKSATIFAPDETLTRAELTSILYRINGEPEVAYEAVFSDVAEDAWYVSPVLWAYKNGVVNGYAEGDFKPDAAITREQLAVIMHNYATAKDYEADASTELDAFDDAAQVSDWAAPAVQWAVATGVISGKDGVRLDPQGNATRAEAAAIIQRFMENVAK